MDRFDYLVLGGGSGGVASARRAAIHGKRVAIVESGRFGGTCVNVGCVPKKIMWNAAMIAETLAGRGGLWLRRRADEARLRAAPRRARPLRQVPDGVYEKNLDAENVTRIKGYGRFLDAHTLDVGGERVSADHVLIATGGKPRVPDVPGAEFGITSDGFFELDARPGRVAIVGGGYIAAELSGVLRHLGSEVTVLLHRGEPLRGFDAMLRTELTSQMRDSGIDVRLWCEITKVRGEKGALFVETKTEEDPRRLRDRRVGHRQTHRWTSGHRARGRGRHPRRDGNIVVDELQVTSVPGIYAVGDVTGQLTAHSPVAIAAGRKLADRLLRRAARCAHGLTPMCRPSCSATRRSRTVGLSEEAGARELRRASREGLRARFTNLYHALTARKPKTTVKLVTTGPEERVVGIHVIGLAADEMIQGFAVALRMGATKADLDRTVAIHPTAAEELVTLR